MASRPSSTLRKPAPRRTTSAAKSRPAKAKSASKAAPSKTSAKAKSKAEAASGLGKLPEWNLTDLYAGIDAPEVARDLDALDKDCVAFARDYKGRLAEETAKPDGGKWLADAV
ncbi:MAG: oligoendopeptidase F, partial [Rhizobiales bacterium]|nr:oligoendopeptidase F [Hyphomicrobiales bacterium]